MNTDLRLRVRLIKKLADSLDGVDVSGLRVGDCADLPPALARTLILEGWAEMADPMPVETVIETPPDPNENKPPDEPEPY